MDRLSGKTKLNRILLTFSFCLLSPTCNILSKRQSISISIPILQRSRTYRHKQQLTSLNGGSDILFGEREGKALLVYLLEISFISQTKPSNAVPLLWLCVGRERKSEISYLFGNSIKWFMYRICSPCFSRCVCADEKLNTWNNTLKFALVSPH